MEVVNRIKSDDVATPVKSEPVEEVVNRIKSDDVATPVKSEPVEEVVNRIKSNDVATPVKSEPVEEVVNRIKSDDVATPVKSEPVEEVVNRIKSDDVATPVKSEPVEEVVNRIKSDDVATPVKSEPVEHEFLPEPTQEEKECRVICKVPLALISTTTTHFRRGMRDGNFKITIKSVLKGIDDKLTSEAKKNFYSHMLTKFFTNPQHFPNISVLIFIILEHLQENTENFLLNFRDDRAKCIFLLPSERCISTSICEIGKTFEDYPQQKLIENLLSTIHHVVMSVKNCNIDGLASLCRVFTAICKRTRYKLKILKLCVEMLKIKHRFAPFLIATITGVWQDIFTSSSDQCEEESILLRSVSVGARRKPKKLDESHWACSQDVLSEFFNVPTIGNISEALSFLKNKISISTEQSDDKLWMLTASVVILTGEYPWDWIKKHEVDEFISPCLSRFATEEPNEKYFSLFCNLFVDVYHLTHSLPFEILLKYFRQRPKEGSSFVQDSAAVSMIKYLIIKRLPIQGSLAVWVENNTSKLTDGNIGELYIRRNLYYCKGLKKVEDIIIM